MDQVPIQKIIEETRVAIARAYKKGYLYAKKEGFSETDLKTFQEAFKSPLREMNERVRAL